MVAAADVGQQWTVEQYLAMERGSPIRHQLIDGRVYAMPGGDRRHSRLGVNVVRVLAERLDSSPCQVFNSDMKVRLSNERDHVYPDASVSCDERDLADDTADYIRYPCLVIEVLSDSTERYDRGAKFDLYRARQALREYVLVSPAQVAVEVRRREESGTWATTIYGPGEDVVLHSVGLTIPITALYRGLSA